MAIAKITYHTLHQVFSSVTTCEDATTKASQVMQRMLDELSVEEINSLAQTAKTHTGTQLTQAEVATQTMIVWIINAAKETKVDHDKLKRAWTLIDQTHFDEAVFLLNTVSAKKCKPLKIQYLGLIIDKFRERGEISKADTLDAKLKCEYQEYCRDLMFDLFVSVMQMAQMNATTQEERLELAYLASLAQNLKASANSWRKN